MRAILTRCDENCKPIATAGNDPNNRRLTKSYNSFTQLYRYTILPALHQWDGRMKVEIWYGENIYKDCDNTMTWNTHIFPTS